MSQLLIRAEIISAISKLQTARFNDKGAMQDVVINLKNIENKDLVLKVLIKEIFHAEDDKKLGIVAFLLNELIDKEKMDLVFTSLLQDKTITDHQKYKLIKMMRTYGNFVKYENFENYLESPDEIIEEDTNLLVNNSLANPEIQIDFLDFLSSLSQSDGENLINSLIQDFMGDSLVHLLYPILYSMPKSPYFLMVVKALGNTKSLNALNILTYLEPFYKDDKTLASVFKTSISTLKLSTFKENLQLIPSNINSEFRAAFITIPDGAGNFSAMVSRSRQDGTIQVFSVALNLYIGILDCFGFNCISETEYQSIQKKFNANVKFILISQDELNFILNNYERIQLEKNEKISYEYACWKHLLQDSKDITLNIDELYMQNLSTVELNQNHLQRLYNDFSELDSWYFDEFDNENFLQLIDELQKKYYFKKEITINELNEIVDNKFENIYSDKFINQLSDKILFTAYLLNLRGDKEVANILYSFLDDKNISILNIFLKEMFKKSLYLLFVREKENFNYKSNNSNIFKQKQSNDIEQLFDIEITLKAIELIEKNWVVQDE